MKNISWVKKYMPDRLCDVAGQGYALEQLRNFVKDFKRGKALLLYGPSGTGKSCSVYALAHDLKYEIVEVNASDTRNSAQIDQLLGSAVKQASLFYKSKIILVDELDGISGTKDRGGANAIIKLVKTSPFPIVMTANDPFAKKFSSLRKKSVMVEYQMHPHKLILEKLRHICKQEGVDHDEQALSMLARRSGGDLRAAINDLQTMAATDKKLSREQVEDFGDRDKTEKITQALLKVLKTTDPDVALGAFDNVDEDLDKVFLWVDYNMPKEYLKPLDLARGFEELSRADVFKGRIMRWQYYRFYVYCYALLSAGIALAKDEKYKSLPKFKQTSRLLKIWWANRRNAKKKAIAEKIAEKTHTSSRRALQDSLPYLKPGFEKGSSSSAAGLAHFLELDQEQVDWMKDSS